ncbi:MAG: dihydroorotate dehydrogenase electron transfer subunit [Bacteroidaceae bacterium]|nr:dihydroorotate dehydrogenase electron transfer subunit [Bacteroidaceae bacterium]
MKKSTQTDLIVRSSERLSDSAVLVSMQACDPVPDVRPGQFLQLLLPSCKGAYLRRPYSIHDFDSETGTVSLLVQMVGTGSRAVAELKAGDVVNALMPLGNGFDLESQPGNSLLVAGGVGMAPMYLLGKELKAMNRNFTFLFGARGEKQLLRLEAFRSLAPVAISTQDGSVGETGLVTDNSILAKGGFDSIFCCGPTPMMKAVAKYASQNNLPCQVSLEHHMACGMGACLCCVEDTVEGHVCVCKEGPVFDIKKLKWQI